MQIKCLFYKFLEYRAKDGYKANLYLILMLLVIDFSKMDEHLKKKNQL
jgi:hypothetical protein